MKAIMTIVSFLFGLISLPAPPLPCGQSGEELASRLLAGDPRLGALTARLVLSHRSGLPNWRWQRPDKKLAFEFDPGSSFAYSGEGYLFLQRVIERKTGRSLEQLCRQYVFEPLGMKASQLRPGGDGAVLQRRESGRAGPRRRQARFQRNRPPLRLDGLLIPKSGHSRT